MTDQNLNTEEQEQTPAPEAETETQPETNAEVKQFTQAQLDAILTDRLARAKKQREEAEAKTKQLAEAEALKQNAEWQKLAEQREAELAKLQAKIQENELLELKRQVAKEFELPEALASRLQGEDLDALKADAAALSQEIPKQKPQPKISIMNPGSTATGETRDERNRRLGLA